MSRPGVAALVPTFLSHDEPRDVAERMLKLSGRRVDLGSPLADDHRLAPTALPNPLRVAYGPA